MAVIDLSIHPFQRNDLEHNADWQGLEFWSGDEGYFIERTAALNAAFQEAVSEGRLWPFLRAYTRLSKEMLSRAGDIPLMAPILRDVLIRLINYNGFLRLRTRDHLCQSASVHSWQFDEALIAKAKAAADEMERQNIEVQDYDLNKDPEMNRWLTDTIKPLLREYVGTTVISPWAHIRYVNAEKHGQGWAHIYRQHPYAYFHFDEVCYSLPLIIYLSDVGTASGPFSYVDKTDKMAQNLVLRAFHQALWHGCKVLCHTESDRKQIAKLPAVFRGGDLIGSLTGPTPFASHRVVPFTDRAGAAVLFEGFQLLHAG